MKRTPLRKVSPNKVKKPKAHDSGWWQNKADSLMQDIGRKLTDKCEVCGKDNQVGHHFITKQASSYLRYDWKNLIPLCHACHFNHHIKSDPHVSATIIRKRGQDWYNYLEKNRRKEQLTGVKYYQKIIEDLERYLLEEYKQK